MQLHAGFINEVGVFMNADINIIDLLKKPVCVLTGEEYVALHTYAHTLLNGGDAKVSQVVRIKGVQAVAEYCACSPSQIAKLLREGVLGSAILSRIGKTIVFDGEEARHCANEYQMKQRASRREKKE